MAFLFLLAMRSTANKNAMRVGNSPGDSKIPRRKGQQAVEPIIQLDTSGLRRLLRSLRQWGVDRHAAAADTDPQRGKEASGKDRGGY